MKNPIWFHINDKGNIAVCIEDGNCEIGDESRHHLTREAAQDSQKQG